MRIPVSSDIESFYHQIIGLLSNFMPIKNLAKKQRLILAELLYQNYLLRDYSEDKRRILIFSKESRKKISKKIGISEDSLYTQLNYLRKAGVLSKDNKLPKFLTYLLPKKRFEFTVQFNIIDNE